MTHCMCTQVTSSYNINYTNYKLYKIKELRDKVLGQGLLRNNYEYSIDSLNEMKMIY